MLIEMADYSALYEDACLYIVPGSHKQPRTPEQRQKSSTQEAPKDPMDMPGALQVTIKRTSSATRLHCVSCVMALTRSSAGETVFYNSNILHCATYSPHAARATLHACMGDIRGGSTRARNVLQHELGWMAEDVRFRAGLSSRGVHMLDNLIQMRNDVAGEVGYSLKE
jgi:hypothetical protein